jgi:tetratricopeptide (TPR) repeat protein
METSQIDQMEFTSGILYLANDKPRKAAETFQHVMESAKRKEDDARASVVGAYLGSSYALLRREEDAHKAFEESLAITKKRKGDAADLLEELMVMADLARESNEHAVEKGFLQRALSMAEGMTDESKIKQQISMMIEAVDSRLSGSQQA